MANKKMSKDNEKKVMKFIETLKKEIKKQNENLVPKSSN